MPPQLPSDAETLRGLRQRDNAAYDILYQFYYPMVERFVLRNDGCKADAQDVFQETVLVLLDKVPRADFVLTSSLKTYLYAIASNLWLKRLRTARRAAHVELTDALPAAAPAPAATEEALPHTLHRWLARITAHCQALLKSVFFLRKKASDLGYKNPHTAQNQQYKCLQQLRQAANPAELASADTAARPEC